MRTCRALLVAVVALGVFASTALAQSDGGAFSKLSPGQQKIARALFEAQLQGPGPKTSKPLSLDEIAMKRQAHQGWGEVFKDMKASGLVTDKNLGQVVKSWEHRHPETARADRPKPEKMDKMDKPDKPEKSEKIEKPEKLTRH
jgi:hypothetical protein